MSLHFLATVKIQKDQGIPPNNWVQIGKLYWDAEKSKARLLLYGWKSGWAKADPHEQTMADDKKAPYIHGDMFIVTDAWTDAATGQPKTSSLWVGYVVTKESSFGTFYGLHFEICPLVPPQERGFWIEVRE